MTRWLTSTTGDEKRTTSALSAAAPRFYPVNAGKYTAVCYRDGRWRVGVDSLDKRRKAYEEL